MRRVSFRGAARLGVVIAFLAYVMIWTVILAGYVFEPLGDRSDRRDCTTKNSLPSQVLLYKRELDQRFGCTLLNQTPSGECK